MAYVQWISITIKPNCNVVIKNLNLKYGKLYFESKDDEEDISEVKNKVIPAKQFFKFSACGREHSASGTEGLFDLYDGNTGVKIGNYYWECPWSSKTNTSSWDPACEDYITQVSGSTIDSGLLVM